LKVHLHHYSKMKSHKEVTEQWKSQFFFLSFFCLLMAGSGSVTGAGSTLHPLELRCTLLSWVPKREEGESFYRGHFVSRYIQIISILISLWGFRNSMKTMKTIGRYYLWRQDLTGFCWYEYVLWRPALWRWKAAPWPYHPGTSSATTWASWQSILNVISPKTVTTQGLKNGKSYPWWYNFKTTVYLVDNIFF
jgi:hypothetical protein